MQRRAFLKLCCAAVVAPSLSHRQDTQTIQCDYSEGDDTSLVTIYQVGPDGEYKKLLQFIAERQDAARQAMIADLERDMVRYWVCDRALTCKELDTILREPDHLAGWITVAMPLNYKL